jgi:hypothetical protein
MVGLNWKTSSTPAGVEVELWDNSPPQVIETPPVEQVVPVINEKADIVIEKKKVEPKVEPPKKVEVKPVTPPKPVEKEKPKAEVKPKPEPKVEAPKEKPIPLKKLREEGDLIKRAPKLERKERITKRLSDLTGESGEKLDELWQKFTERRKNVESDGLALKKVINEYNKSKEPEVVNPPTVDEIRSYYNIITNLEPENSKYNLEQFKKYVLKGMSLTSALSKVRYLISSRNYMRENNIPITAVNVRIFLVSDGDFELAARRVKEREEAGKLGIDVDNLNAPNASNNDYVIYNGERINLHRLVQLLFRGKTNEKQIKMMYAVIRTNVFDKGMSVDDSVENAYKRLNIMYVKNQLKEEFPEDPSYAETIFEEYYIDENMSLQDALEATRRDLGKDPSN